MLVHCARQGECSGSHQKATKVHRAVMRLFLIQLPIGNYTKLAESISSSDLDVLKPMCDNGLVKIQERDTARDRQDA